ncbi:hypothetical protein L2X99_02865 [Microbacterium sp. KUDC0406]|uniref:hypothetical protein n=1 Tax=Microbacterium sp. KUDC0406 TaxID=2909588 RepID=UPI001F18DC86|nr:hypothetical protein [Microbacterium sp. KUDC0406]UJP10632.1 hypothetical protein L2X99_02865 [Microbacterium sp. KUDC0406]
MSKAAILRGMRESTERRKRADAAAVARARAASARARLDALSDHPEPAPVDPLAAAAERTRRLAPYRSDITRMEQARRADLLAAIPDQHPEFEWSPT